MIQYSGRYLSTFSSPSPVERKAISNNDSKRDSSSDNSDSDSTDRYNSSNDGIDCNNSIDIDSQSHNHPKNLWVISGEKNTMTSPSTMPGLVSSVSSDDSNTVPSFEADNYNSSNATEASGSDPFQTPFGNAHRSYHKSTSFIRVADLNLDLDRISLSHQIQGVDVKTVSHPEHPPRSICADPRERSHWIGLDCHGHLESAEIIEGSDDCITHTASVYVPIVVQSLVKTGLGVAFTDSMWTAYDRQTSRLMAEHRERLGRGFPADGPLEVHVGTKADSSNIMIWTGYFPQSNHYGHDLPLVKSRGIIAMKPVVLAELLIDSSRVGTYNKSSLGRDDLQVFADDLYGEQGVIKVTRSRAKPPLISKKLEFVSLLHARRLRQEDEAGDGFVVVSRAVAKADDHVESDVVRSEVLINVHLLRAIDGEKNRCEMININHLRSPLVPTFIAKKLGLAAAVSFINDIRALC